MHIHVSILPQTPLPSRLRHGIEQTSLCYTVGPCWSQPNKYLKRQTHRTPAGSRHGTKYEALPPPSASLPFFLHCPGLSAYFFIAHCLSLLSLPPHDLRHTCWELRASTLHSISVSALAQHFPIHKPWSLLRPPPGMSSVFPPLAPASPI